MIKCQRIEIEFGRKNKFPSHDMCENVSKSGYVYAASLPSELLLRIRGRQGATVRTHCSNADNFKTTRRNANPNGKLLTKYIFYKIS